MDVQQPGYGKGGVHIGGAGGRSEDDADERTKPPTVDQGTGEEERAADNFTPIKDHLHQVVQR